MLIANIQRSGKNEARDEEGEDQNHQGSDSNSITDPDFIKVIHEVTQETRHDLLQLIVGHPHGAPSLDELTYMAKNVNNKATVHEHLTKLIDVGVVKKVEAENQPAGNPRVFYRMSPEWLEKLQERGLLVHVTALKQAYEKTEKPDEIKKAEEAPRPGDAYDGELDEEVVERVLREFANRYDDPETAAERLRWLREDESNESSKRSEGMTNKLYNAINMVRDRTDSDNQRLVR